MRHSTMLDFVPITDQTDSNDTIVKINTSFDWYVHKQLLKARVQNVDGGIIPLMKRALFWHEQRVCQAKAICPL